MNDLLNRISSKPGIFGGKPIIRGMRFRVVDVLEMLANGMTKEQILKEHPILEDDDVKACLFYAMLKLNHPVIYARTPH